MSKNLSKIFPFLLFALVISIFAPQNSLAYTRDKINLGIHNDFIVEPVRTELFLDIGESTEKQISIANRSKDTVRFILGTEDFIGTDIKEEPVRLLGQDISAYSLKNFIIPEISEFNLGPEEMITLSVKISVPENASPQGYYGALIVSNQGKVNNLEEKNRASVTSRIGSLFLLKIKGKSIEQGKLDDFKIIGPKKLFYNKRPDGFEIAFKNKGNVHLTPTGEIKIRNIWMQTADTLSIKDYFVLPNSTRYKEIKW
mgnify:FL=1